MVSLILIACSVALPASAPLQATDVPVVPAPAQEDEVEVVLLEHAYAPEVAHTLQTFLARGERVLADQRTNALLVSASAESRARVKRLLVALDMERSGAAGASPASAPAPALPSSVDSLFAQAERDLVLEFDGPEDTLSMADVARQYARITGQHLFYTGEADQILQNTRSGLASSVTVPAGEVQSFFEALMKANDFCIQLVHGGRTRTLAIQSLKTQARSTVKMSAIFIPESEVEAAGRHPALMFTTIIRLDNVDVRQLANTLRTMLTDANTQQMLPAGDTSSMILTGFGDVLHAQVQLLRAIDAASRPEARTLPAPPADEQALQSEGE